MRPSAVAWLWSASLAFGAATVACFDLFHSTADLLTECAIDAATPGCLTGGKDFCEWTSIEARKHAEHACAWLGACETPMGKNAFGSCVFQGLLAFDCAANPNHRVKGRARELWGCLSLAQSCDDVDACVFAVPPRGLCQSTGDYASCAAPQSDVHIECHDAGAMPYGRT